MGAPFVFVVQALRLFHQHSKENSSNRSSSPSSAHDRFQAPRETEWTGEPSAHGDHVRLRHAARPLQVHGGLLVVLLPLWAVGVAALSVQLIDLIRVPLAEYPVEIALQAGGFSLLWIFLLAFPLLVWRQQVAVRDASLAIDERGMYCRPPREPRRKTAADRQPLASLLARHPRCEDRQA